LCGSAADEHADPDGDAKYYRDRIQYTHGHRYLHRDELADRNAHLHGDGYRHANGNLYADRYRDGYKYAVCYPHAN
jgi:hypothetical protein